MFLRRHRKEAAGEIYEYWTLCESIRTAAGPRQRVVATLGKLGEEAPAGEAGWEEIDALLEGRPVARQRELGEPAEAEGAVRERWELVDLRGVRVERTREFGAVWLGLALWRRLGLHTLLRELIEPGEEEVPWESVACLLTVARFGGQRSELGVARALVSAHGAGGSARGRLGEGQRRPPRSRSRRARRGTRKSSAPICWSATRVGSGSVSSSCFTT